MNIKQLIYFSAVAKHESISQAAIHLAMAQSALSRHINQLERDLGIRLFHRHGRGVSLTRAGEKLLSHGRAAIKHLQQARREIESLKDAPQDSTAIGFPPTVALLLSVPLALQFQQRFPLSHLRIEEAYSGLILEWLAAGKIDIAVVYETPNSGNILGDKVMNEQLYLIGPADSPISSESQVNAQQLGELPMVLPNHPHGLRLLLDQKSRQAKIEMNIVMEVNGLEITKSLIKSSSMYTVLPYAAVHKEVVEGSLTAAKIVRPSISRSLILASSTRNPLSDTSREIMRVIRELIADLDRAGEWLQAPTRTRKTSTKK